METEEKRKFLIYLRYEADIEVYTEKEVRAYIRRLKKNLANYQKFEVNDLDIEVEEF